MGEMSSLGVPTDVGHDASAVCTFAGGMHRLFEAVALQHAMRTAIEHGNEFVTYAELDRRANRIAWALRHRGVGPGSLVGLYLPKSTSLYAAMLGILKAGAGYVPVDLRFPVDRVQGIFADAGVKAIVTTRELNQGLKPSRAARLELDHAKTELQTKPDRAVMGLPGPEELASTCYVIYTSGSTGHPKGVIVSHQNVKTFASALRTEYRISENDRIYQGFSTAFDASVEEIWAAFSSGATLCVPSEEVSRSPTDAAEFINANGITYFSTVPTFLSMVSIDLPTVHTLVLGGEACPPDLVSRWATPGRRMLNTYGPTETTVVATMSECAPGKLVTIGRPLPGYVTYIVDENMRLVPAGTPGELLVGGNAVAGGYLKRETLTAEKFIPNPFTEQAATAPILYRTHDLVCEMPDGNIQFLGRIDDQVKIRGFRVELQEIESVLLDEAGIRGAAVRVLHLNGLPELAAYVVQAEGADLDREGLVSRLRARLPDYMIPRFLDVVSALPVTTSGKIDRSRLPEPATQLQVRTKAVEPPASELESRLLSVWNRHFPGTSVSVLDDFFLDLGGHSLLAAQVATELRSDPGTANASVVHLYTFRTIRALAAFLGEWRPTDARTSEAGPANDNCGDTEAERTFQTVPKWERYTTVTLQAVALLIYHGIQMTPVVFMGWLGYGTLAGSIAPGDAAWLGTLAGFFAWPAMLAIAIAMKWMVIGRFQQGRYPVWGLYYCRWWVVNLFQHLSWSHMFAGTPLMSLYFRAMGASVGPRCTILTPVGSAYDLVTIGEGSTVGTETHLSAYRVENGWLEIGRIDIGKRCFVGTQASLGLNTRLEDDVWIDDLSQVPDSVVISQGARCQGVPLKGAAFAVPDQTPGACARPVLYGFLHLLLIYAMGYLLIFAALPGLALAAFALTTTEFALGPLALLAAAPVSIVWYGLCVVAVKKFIIGPIRPTTCSIYSSQYLRLWFNRYLMANTRQILMPLYATVYLPWFYRLLGAKIGKNTEISTLNEATPDLLDIGEGSFLADECIIGALRIHNGTAELLPVRIGNRSFVGNSALIKGGFRMGDNSLLALMSTATDARAFAEGKGQWLGSPAFPLPRPVQDLPFGNATLFSPPAEMVRKRYFVDAVRILLPSFIWMAAMLSLAVVTTLTFEHLPLWSWLLVLPLASVLSSVGEIGAVALIKFIVSGRFQASVHPLWSEAVILDEIVNGVYESLSTTTLAPLQGTPFLAPALRLLGCRIGKWCFLDTTYFSEFDLVKIGDFAAINQGATIQTHLFEDRVMKSGEVRLGNGCAIGNMGIVLYDTEIEAGVITSPMSVVMKGERLTAGTRWIGVPCQQASSVPTISGMLAPPEHVSSDSRQTRSWQQAAQ